MSLDCNWSPDEMIKQIFIFLLGQAELNIIFSMLQIKFFIFSGQREIRAKHCRLWESITLCFLGISCCKSLFPFTDWELLSSWFHGSSCCRSIFPLVTLRITVISHIISPFVYHLQGRIQGGGVHPARAPPKIGKSMIFWRKIVIFHTKYPKNVRASLRHWKKYDFWRKIVIFHTKYPKIFHTSLRSAHFF